MRNVNKITKLLKNKIILAVMATLMLSLIVVPQMVSAQRAGADDVFGTKEIDNAQTGIALGKQSLQKTVVQIINVSLSLLGIIAVVIILIGGFKWMTAGGAEDKVTEARKLIFAGIIGMAIILSAWAIARFVLSNLAAATSVQGSVLPE